MLSRGNSYSVSPGIKCLQSPLYLLHIIALPIVQLLSAATNLFVFKSFQQKHSDSFNSINTCSIPLKTHIPHNSPSNGSCPELTFCSPANSRKRWKRCFINKLSTDYGFLPSHHLASPPPRHHRLPFDGQTVWRSPSRTTTALFRTPRGPLHRPPDHAEWLLARHRRRWFTGVQREAMEKDCGLGK